MRSPFGRRLLKTFVACGAPLALLFVHNAHANEAAWPPLPEVARAITTLPNGATLIAFDPAGANRVFLAQVIAATSAQLVPHLSNAQAYRKAIPSFERANVIATQTHAGQTNVHVAWELEIPLWNLSGQLWFKPFDQALQVRLSAGAFAPGQFLWQWHPLPARDGTDQMLLVLHGTANTRDANWATRKIAGRSPLAEPAMTVAAAYTLIEAMVDHVVNSKPNNHPQRWPQAAMNAPLVHTLQPQLHVVAQKLKHPGPLGLVLRHANGRLDHVAIAVWSPQPAHASLQHLAQPAAWRTLPGWKRITPSAPVPAATHPYRQSWQVDASFPFLDFDATWDVVVSSGIKGLAINGPGRGAVWSWQASDAAKNAPTPSLLVFSLYPRLDKLGFLPRRFIAKEPLLEGGLALALAYVNAVTLARTLPAPN